jgi:hypothetical protein
MISLAKADRTCPSNSDFLCIAGNRLDVSAYRCVDVAGRNRQNLPCAYRLRYGRLSPGACDRQRRTVQKVQELVRGRAVALAQEISMHKDGQQVVETAVEARGGLLGRPVLLVLIVSCVLAAAALIVTYSGT